MAIDKLPEIAHRVDMIKKLNEIIDVVNSIEKKYPLIKIVDFREFDKQCPQSPEEHNCVAGKKYWECKKSIDGKHKWDKAVSTTHFILQILQLPNNRSASIGDIRAIEKAIYDALCEICGEEKK